MGRLSHAAQVLVLVVAGCAGERSSVDPCAGVTCAVGRSCVEGRCISPDGGLPFPDGTPDGPLWPDGSPDGAVIAEAGAEAGADAGADATVDGPSPCPNPATAAGGYSGDFVDGAGGALAKGKVTFTLTAGTPPVMTLAGSIDGTALPGLMNYKIKGTLTGVVTCGVIATTFKGTLDGYGFDGVLNGLLVGKTASGVWAGQQSGGGIAVSGNWNATHN